MTGYTLSVIMAIQHARCNEVFRKKGRLVYQVSAAIVVGVNPLKHQIFISSISYSNIAI